uniref:DLEC1 cilia and flagella associated protein n=1 Tax=Oryzias latipes TaxID=8090 RepID=A0A3P9HUW3_ORYLA
YSYYNLATVFDFQDISNFHVLKSVFPDIYSNDIIGENLLSNLVKTKNGRDSFHCRHVEELQQAFFEYNQCMKETEKLKSHLIQARAQAAAKEKHAFERMTENLGDISEYQDLFIGFIYFYFCLLILNYCLINMEHGAATLGSGAICGSFIHLLWLFSFDEKHQTGFFLNESLVILAMQNLSCFFFPLRNGDSLSGHPHPIFVAKPSVVTFTDYKVGHIYETTLELRNVTSSSRHVRVLSPNSPHFAIGLGRFPSEEGTIAPGMSCKYSLRFIPDSLEDYKDFLVVETQAEQVLLVPIEAQRPPPILTLPRVLDCGYCLVGGLKYVEFLCRNVGQSSGTFCIIPKSQWPFSNLRSLSRTYFSEQPPFAVGPSLFQLEPGDTTVIEVIFYPTTAQKSRQTYTFVCDNCQVKDFSIEGQLVALELISEEKEPPEAGEVHDVTAEHYVQFDVSSHVSHLDLPFQWQIRQPNLYPLPPGEVPEPSQIHFHPATDDAFRISPVAGLLPPYQDQEFLLTFSVSSQRC